MRHRYTLSSQAFVSLALMLGVALFGTNVASAQDVTQVSTASDGTPADGDSSGPSISADGRFVAFLSSATNLVPSDTNGKADVFVKDRVSGATTRVSVTTSGQQNTEHSAGVRISANGRFVMFSTLGVLVPEDTSNCAISPLPVAPCADIYVHDRETGATTLATVSSAGVQANKASVPVDISADGRFVLFGSVATNLVPNDTNDGNDLFLRDRQSGTTTLVSLDRAGNQAVGYFNLGALWARMSADGRIIVYGPVAGTDVGAVYQYERETGTVSVLSDALPASDLQGEPTESWYRPLSISDDGRLVVVAQQVQSPAMQRPQVRYLFHDRLTGHTTADSWWLVHLLSEKTFDGLSGDGRVYALAGINQTTTLTDRVNGLSEPVPTALQNGGSGRSLSSDGRFVAFDRGQQVYIYDRDSGDSDGMPGAWETTFGLNPTNLTDANADADLDGVTNLQEYLRGSHPTAVASATRYFAEGAANAFFTTRLAAVNPGDEAAAVVFRFLGSGGQTSSVMRTIEPRSRISLVLRENGLAPVNDFSTVIESNRTVVVDRTMTWDATSYGAHTETAITAPSTTWYLAEGATHGAFDLFYLLQNANDARANVTINYLRQAPLTPVSKTYAVEPNSRRTIPVDGEGVELEAVDTAAAITSDLPIVVERAMYSTRPGQPAFAAGHGAAGVTAPALRWFLAEGATGNFFDLFVLVGNPNTTASNLKVTYLLPSGAPFEKTYSVGPRQRLTINVQDEDTRLANTPVSVIVESTNNQPVVVERAMWWPKDQWHEAHVSAGATTTGTRWALAEGEVTVGGDTYILIANTSTTAGTATVTLLEEAETPVTITVDLPPSSRVNVPVSAYLPATDLRPFRRFGALIETNGVEIVVERSIYWTVGGITWGAGTAALGTKLQ
jgi:Tol biopolymer transport system component